MKIDPQWVVKLQGSDYVRFPGLLDLAHRSGLRCIETTLIQAPNPGNQQTAIMQAQATFRTEDGDVCWGAFGDASPASVKANMVPSIIRMAETRAIGRALRMACNIGQTMLEELPDEEAAQVAHRANGATDQAAVRKARPAVKGAPVRVCEAAGCGEILTDEMVQACAKYWKAAVYCHTHGRQMIAAGQVDFPKEIASATADQG